MKTKNILILVAAILVIAFTTSCTKDPGAGGSASISGIIKNTDGEIAGAQVYITYDSAEKTDSYDNTTLTMADGSYSFEGLTKGDYYVEASYINDQGFSFVSTGYSVTIGSKKSELVIDIDLE